MGTIRVLVANELRTYQAFIAATLQQLRPHVRVIAVESHELDSSILRLSPQLVICSRLSEVVETRPLSWVLMYPGGDSTVTLSIAGKRDTRADVELSELLSIIDRTELLMHSG